MTLIRPENLAAFATEDFGVVAAIDDSMEHPSYYVIIAPSLSAVPTNLNDVDLGHHATILPPEASEIIIHLTDMINEWDKPTPDTAAIFYEFTTHTQMPIPSNSTLIATQTMLLQSTGPNEEGWVPSLDIMFNRTSRGSIMSITIGTPKFNYRYDLKDKTNVIAFKNQMEKALSILTGKGMR